jgi:hypothetical protein
LSNLTAPTLWTWAWTLAAGKSSICGGCAPSVQPLWRACCYRPHAHMPPSFHDRLRRKSRWRLLCRLPPWYSGVDFLGCIFQNRGNSLAGWEKSLSNPDIDTNTATYFITTNYNELHSNNKGGRRDASKGTKVSEFDHSVLLWPSSPRKPGDFPNRRWGSTI